MIRTRAKVLATGMIVMLVGYMALLTEAPAWTVAVTVVLILVGLGFVWSRPSRPRG